MMNNEEKILAMLESLTSDMTEVKAVQARQGKQIDRIEGRLDTMDGRLDTMDKHLKEVDERSMRNGVLLENDVAAKVQAVLDGHDVLARTLASKEQVEKLAEDVDIVKSVVTQHSADIRELKRA